MATQLINKPARFGLVGPALQIGSGRGARFIAVALIVRIEAYGNYSLIYTRTGQQHLAAKTLAALAQRLPSFWRVHKSYLVNPTYVAGSAASVRNKAILRLTTGETVAVSRRMKKAVSVRVVLLNAQRPTNRVSLESDFS